MLDRREFFEALTAVGTILTTEGAKTETGGDFGPWVESSPITEPDPPHLDTLILGRTAPESCNIYVQSLDPPSEWIPVYLAFHGSDFGPLSIAQAFGGVLPQRWRLSMKPTPLPVVAVTVGKEYIGYDTVKATFGKPFIILPAGDQG